MGGTDSHTYQLCFCSFGFTFNVAEKKRKEIISSVANAFQKKSQVTALDVFFCVSSLELMIKAADKWGISEVRRASAASKDG